MLSKPMDRVVIDTNIFVSALMNARGAPRAVLRLALERQIVPVFGNALLREYEDVLSRDRLFASAPVARGDIDTLLDALLSVSEWRSIYYLWRPNLPDEGDNHLIELAVAANAEAIITANTKDFARADLVFEGLNVVTAGGYLETRSQS
ncbi:MAG: putative toxin-antitoxin system toxin component, PIN family [Hyphomonas sp.]